MVTAFACASGLCAADSRFCRFLKLNNYIGVVAEKWGRMLGFTVRSIHKHGIVIANMAIDPEFRRLGIGTELIDHAKCNLNERRNRIEVWLRESDLPAQLFFRSQGFRAEQGLRRFYEDTDEDAFVMEYRTRVRDWSKSGCVSHWPSRKWLQTHGLQQLSSACHTEHALTFGTGSRCGNATTFLKEHRDAELHFTTVEEPQAMPRERERQETGAGAVQKAVPGDDGRETRS
jgi:GNAT superfamily N-acetyltransferase